MRTRGRNTSIVANPVLIGATTVLVVVVAVTLAYNANNGLPFVPAHRVSALVPNADGLRVGDDVRIAGRRVGSVTSVTPVPRRGHGPIARIGLKLETSLGRLSADSSVEVRPVSALGLKYLDLVPGRSRRTLEPGRPLPLRQARTPVDYDQLLATFDTGTRESLRRVVTALGNGVAGRGTELNDAIAAAPPLVRGIDDVSANLASPATDLDGFLAGATAGMEAIAPRALELARLLDVGGQTFAAIAAAGPALSAALDAAPAAERVGARELAVTRPVLAQTAQLLRAIRPGTRLLPAVAPNLADLLARSRPVLRRVPALGRRLGPLARSLNGLFRDPATLTSVRELTAGLGSLVPTLRFVNPMQTACNYLGLWTRNVTSVISQGDAYGTWMSYTPIVQLDQMVQQTAPVADLHVNPYPATGQNGECEAGNEGFAGGQAIGSTSVREPGATEPTSPPPGVTR